MRWILLLGLFLVACQATPFCTDMTDAYDKNYCLLNTGLEQNDTAACDEITDENLQIWCYTDVANNLNDATICEELEDTSRQNCIKNVGINLNDVSLCESIRVTEAGDRCYQEIATVIQDPALCLQIASPQLQNYCYLDLAEEKTDYRLCTNIRHDDKSRDACIFRTSLKANETEGCDATILQEYHDICYFNHAIKFFDKTLCDEIFKTSMQGSCRAAVKLESEKAAQ